MTDTTQRTDGEIIANLAASDPDLIYIGNRGAYDLNVLPVREGYRLEQFTVDSIDPRPSRKRGTATFDDAASFLDYIDRQDETPTIYGDCGSDVIQFTAVFNDHHGGEPGWRDFVAVLSPRFTPEWARWTETSGEWFTATEFAEFVEDHQHLIADPSTSDLVDLVRNFRATRKVTFGEEINDHNGDRALTWKTETSTGELAIPTTLTLMIQPFWGDDPGPVTTRFRYRLDDGRAMFGHKLVQPHLAIAEAARMTDAKITQGGHDILHGRPAAEDRW